MKTIKLLSISVFIVLFAVACTDESTVEPTQTLQFTTVEKANRSAITEQRFVTVRDSKSWKALWEEHSKNDQPPPTIPVIDFKEAMVLGVFLGTRPNTCYTVTIETVEQVANKRLQVKYREVKTGSVCGQAETQPLHLISLKSTPLPVEFIALQ
jgi:hypothetical protein